MARSGEFSQISAMELAQEDRDDESAEEHAARQAQRRLPRWALVVLGVGMLLVAGAFVAREQAKRTQEEQVRRLDTLRATVARGVAAGVPEQMLAPARKAIAEGEKGTLPVTELFAIADTGIMRVAPCLPNEEMFENLCYEKCAILSHDKYPYRVACNTCCLEEGPCNDPKTYKLLGFGCNGYGIGGGPAGTKTACSHVPLLECSKNEEMYPVSDSTGLCYKKCSILTNSTRSIREGPATCAGTTYGSEYTHGAPCDRDGFNINGKNKCASLPWA